MKKACNLFILLVLLSSCNEVKKADKAEKPIKVKEIVEKNEPKEVDLSEMVYFEGGTITIGSDTGLANEKPSFQKKIQPFYLDKNLVTVKQFRIFIESTEFKTDADNFGDSLVFSFEKNAWELLPGANWEYPLGKGNPKAENNHPVTHVSWKDAMTYCSWAGKRLPTEFEWEYAAKNGENSKDNYAWGMDLVIDGKYMANVWQGETVEKTEVLDGYLRTSPVGAYGTTEAGLTDMGGNVWQWCENNFKPYPENLGVAGNPTVKSTKGGSFMFDQALENSYTKVFRGKNTIETSLFNTGFRCAK